MRPPIISARRLAMESPSPVPSTVRFRCSSNRWKSSNSFFKSSSLMPIPVSFTEKVRTVPFSTLSPRTENVTLPFSVYFTALVKRFMIIWRILISSPMRQSGVSLSTFIIKSRPFCSARYRIMFTMSFNTLRSLYSLATNCIFPDSILEKSRISLIRERRASLARLIFSE